MTLKEDSLYYQQKLLLSSVLGIDIKYIFLGQYTVTPEQKKEYQQGLDLLYHGYPLDYLLGRVSFLGQDFLVDSHVLIPRPETEEWVQKLQLYFAKPIYKDCILVDVGSGSGVIGLSLARLFKQVILTDLSVEALQVARQNAVLNNVTNYQIVCCNLLGFMVENIQGINFKNWILVANLPYLPQSDVTYRKANKISFEPDTALYSGQEGLDLFYKLYEQLTTLDELSLLPQECYFELDPRNILQAQTVLQPLYPNTWVLDDFNGFKRVLGAKK